MDVIANIILNIIKPAINIQKGYNMPNKPKNNYSPGGQDGMQTPPHALEPLIPLLSPEWIMWESAAGLERLIAKTLIKHGFTVIDTDISYDPRFDYFTYQPDQWTIQITNPPYNARDRYAWIKRAFELGRPFALLLPYETSFAARFRRIAKIYHKNPWDVEILVPERRISYKTPNYGWGTEVYDEKKDKMVMKGDSAQFPSAWFTWGLNATSYYPASDFNMFNVPMRAGVKYDSENIERT